MNKQRRKELNEACTLLCSAQESIERAKEVVDGVRDYEEESYENLPESLQESERGQDIYDNVEELDSVVSELDGIFDSVEEQIDAITAVIDK